MLRIYLYRRSCTQGMVDPQWANTFAESAHWICCQTRGFWHSGNRILRAQQTWFSVIAEALDRIDEIMVSPVSTDCLAAVHVATDTVLEINSGWSSKNAEFHKLSSDDNNITV